MRIALTRPEGRNEELAERLRALGHEVLVRPLIATEPLGDGPVDLEGYDWVVVTSPNGAAELARRARGRAGRTAAIGAATAAELPSPAGRVLVAAAEGARRLLVDELGADFVALYRTVELAQTAFPDADLVVLASASAARAYAATGARAPAVSIGPQTTAAAREAGVTVTREARTHDLEGLVEACSSPS